MYSILLPLVLGGCPPDDKARDRTDSADSGTPEAPDSGDLPEHIYAECGDTACTSITWSPGLVDPDGYTYAWFLATDTGFPAEADGEGSAFTVPGTDILLDEGPLTVGLEVVPPDGESYYAYHTMQLAVPARRMAPRTIIVPEFSVTCRNCEVRSGIAGCVWNGGDPARSFQSTWSSSRTSGDAYFDLESPPGTPGSSNSDVDAALGAQWEWGTMTSPGVYSANGTFKVRSVKPPSDYVNIWFRMTAGEDLTLEQTKVDASGNPWTVSSQITCQETTTFCK